MEALINTAIPSHGGFYPLYLKEEAALLPERMEGGIGASSLKARLAPSFIFA